MNGDTVTTASSTPRLVTGDSPRTDAASVTGPQDGYDAQQILELARHPPPGASVYSPNAVPSSALNPRSCVTCRRRKVRCDKHMPCSNCRRAQIPCIFPAPGRAPRRPRPKDPNAPGKQGSSERELELIKRLRKLEGIVEELSSQIEVESVRHGCSPGNSPEAVFSYARDENSIGVRMGSSGAGASHGSPNQGVATVRMSARPTSGSVSEPDVSRKSPPDVQTVHKQFGRLVLNEKKGVTRYVSSTLWTSINDELDELRKASQDLTDEDSEESNNETTPEAGENDRSLYDHQSFVLGYRSADVDLRPLHPLPSQIPFIWQVYQENVDPILKVVHVPTMSKVIKELRNNMDSLTPSTEALMFSIYYASITSLDEDEVKLNFGTDKSVLLRKYRFAFEQALAKAEFLTRPDLTIIQAFLLFLVLVRRHDDTRFSWTLTGLLIRLSQALGLHRDGTHFPNLTPFEVEMRRRIFWALCVLDLRCAEDQGTDLTIVNGTFDTQLPLNINDSDISPESECLPDSRTGTTDMAFSLIRFEVCALSRRLHSAPFDPEAGMSLEQREAMLADVYTRLKEQLLTDPSSPMFWVASNIARIVVAKMTLIIYQPVLFPGSGNDQLSEDVRARLLNAALDIFEYSHILNTDPRCKQWRWLFQTWSHWHALAYTLVETSHRPWGPKTERAWAALNLTFSSPNPAELEKLASHHAVWMPIRKLYLKVKKHREAEIARLRADPQAARELEMQDQAAPAPTSIGNIPDSVKGAIALDRWRKLINLPPLPPQPQQHVPSQPTPQQTPQLQPWGAVDRDELMRQTTAMVGIQPGPRNTMEYNKPDVMEYLDAAMANSTFVPPDLVPLWASEDSDQLARAAFFAYPPAAGVAAAGTSGGFVPSAGIPHGLPSQLPPGGMVHSQSGMVQTPTTGMGSSTQEEHHTQQPQQTPTLPPWMWPATAGTTTTPGVGGATTGESPDILRMPGNMGAEDMDMNMDEGFDWQTWQESLGRYELEANGGRNGSGWAPGL